MILLSIIIRKKAERKLKLREFTVNLQVWTDESRKLVPSSVILSKRSETNDPHPQIAYATDRVKMGGGQQDSICSLTFGTKIKEATGVLHLDGFELCVLCPENKNPHPLGWGFCLVETTGLEPVTSCV